MAGRGPTPKSPEARRRRNVPARGEWREVPSGPPKPAVLPPLPKRAKAEGAWPSHTKMKWAAWRQDPVTLLFGPSEIVYALDTLRLYEHMGASTANEIRLREDGLGFTPKGKRDLRIRVVDPDEAEGKDELAERRSRREGLKARRARVARG